MKTADVKILLVDDEPDILEIVGYNLKSEGYKVYTASSGREGVEKAKEFLPDLILLDVMMPEMDGIELARHCSKVAPRTQVMFITGFSGVVLKAGESVPNAKILSKPFHLRDLVLEVERLFAKESFGELK